MIKNLKALLCYLATRIIIRFREEETLSSPMNATPGGTQMVQNDYLAGLLVASGVPQREAIIRAEIFRPEEMLAVPGKVYLFRQNFYWFEA